VTAAVQESLGTASWRKHWRVLWTKLQDAVRCGALGGPTAMGPSDASGEDPEFRSGLPLNFSHIMGSWCAFGLHNFLDAHHERVM
jgi:hypothetical protein